MFSEMFLQIEDYLIYCNTKGLSKKTIKSYEQSLKLFERYCTEKGITTYSKVTNKTIMEYIKFIKERGKYTVVADETSKEQNKPQNRTDLGKRVTPSTINNYIRNIKAFSTYCADYQITKTNLASKIKYLPQKRSEKEFITDGQFKILLHTFNLSLFHEYRDFTITNLLIDTGMRISECLLIKIENLDLSKRCIFLPAENTKGKKDRIVYFSSQMAALIKHWLKYKDIYTDTEFLFTTQRGNPIINSVYEKNFNKYCARIGLKNVSPIHYEITLLNAF